MKYIFLSNLLLSIFSCSILKQAMSIEFEGEVHFELSYESYTDKLTSEHFEKEFGTKMVDVVKKDRYMMIQESAGRLGDTKVIYLLKEGLSYTEFENLDTIIKSDLQIEPGELVTVYKNKGDTQNPTPPLPQISPYPHMSRMASQ